MDLEERGLPEGTLRSWCSPVEYYTGIMCSDSTAVRAKYYTAESTDTLNIMFQFTPTPALSSNLSK